MTNRFGKASKPVRSAVPLPVSGPVPDLELVSIAEPDLSAAQALVAKGDWVGAGEAFANLAKSSTPLREVALLQLARCEVQLDRFMPAREAFANVLRAYPNNFNAWLEAGHLCRQYGVDTQALALYRGAVQAAPDRWEGALALIRILEEKSLHEDAARVYEQALQQVPQALHVQLHWRVGGHRLQHGDLPRALEALRIAALLAGEGSPVANLTLRDEICIDQATTLMRLGKSSEAQEYFHQASMSLLEGTLARVSRVMFEFNLWSEAEQVLRRCRELFPSSIATLQNLANLLAFVWRGDEAQALLQEAELHGEVPRATYIRSLIARAQGHVEQALELKRELLSVNPSKDELRSEIAMLSLYSDKMDAAEIFALHRLMFQDWGKGGMTREQFPNSRDPHRKIRLGLVTADLFHQHPVNIFMQPILARLDPAQFEVVVYYQGIHDEQTHVARSRVAAWRNVHDWRNERLYKQIMEDQTDVLMDLSGHSAMNRLRCFSQRAAPVQISFLGYPGTTGVTNMDWFIADNLVVPVDQEDLYSEKILRLPQTVFCYATEQDYPYPTFPDERVSTPLVFGSFNNTPKISLRCIRLWARILRAVPDAQLLLKTASFDDEAAKAFCVARFEAEGISSERLILRGPTGLSDMMATYAEVDIALDTVPYNGGTTSLQALWMGVPVITVAGESFSARMGCTLLTGAGLSDWVAKDEDGYVRIALFWAEQRSQLLALKRSLRASLQQQPAWDINAYVRTWQQAVRHAWQQYCDEPVA
jgi:predicted O-linked N-acetylglucosamine transferase (SPINDLY family)